MQAERHPDGQPGWHDVCPLDALWPDTGACALVGERQIALVRVGDGTDVFALDNYDPFAGAFVLARGIVGDERGVAKIASPMFKHRFVLATGECLDDPSVRVPVYEVRVRDGRVEVRL
jgi:nitrite reductase (NADH) small subunit